MSDSYYPFFPGDYHRDTGDLSLLEHGAYRVLLDHYYSERGIPADISRLHRICKAHSVEEKAAVEFIADRFFPLNGKQRLNKRAEKEMEKRRKFLESQAEKGRKSANRRWGDLTGVNENLTGVKNLLTQGVTGIQPRFNPGYKKSNPPSPSPSSSPNPAPTKDKKPFVETDEPFRLAVLLFTKMRHNNPICLEPNWQTWAKSIDLMLKKDRRTKEDIEAVIEWCQQDNFWKGNILSTKKLREHFDRLYLKMSQNPKTTEDGIDVYLRKLREKSETSQTP